MEEMEAIEFGDSMMDIVNWYLPQLDLNSPWPPAIMAALGLGAVVGAKLMVTPKNSKKGKQTTEKTTVAPKKPEPPKQQEPPVNKEKPIDLDKDQSELEKKVK